MAVWFEWHDPVTPEVGEFLSALRQSASTWSDADPLDSLVYEFPGQFVVVGLDVCDRERGGVLRTLRLDYGPLRVIYGEDETQQLLPPSVPRKQSTGCFPAQAPRLQNSQQMLLAGSAHRWFGPLNSLSGSRETTNFVGTSSPIQAGLFAGPQRTTRRESIWARQH